MTASTRRPISRENYPSSLADALCHSNYAQLSPLSSVSLLRVNTVALIYHFQSAMPALRSGVGGHLGGLLWCVLGIVCLEMMRLCLKRSSRCSCDTDSHVRLQIL